MTRFSRAYTLTCLLPAVLLAMSLAGIAAPAPGEKGPAGPVVGTTLVDPLQRQPDAIRTLPKLPAVGVWGVVPGSPATDDGNFGILIAKPGQGVIYPTTGLLSPTAGAIEFSIKLPAGYDQNETQPRLLLDTWSGAGSTARLQVALAGKTLTLTWTEEGGKATPVSGTVNWAARSIHKITVVWDAEDASLYTDGLALGKLEKPRLFVKEPLGLVLGNARELNAPAGVAVSSLRMSTAKEPSAPANVLRMADATPNEELSLKMAQGYDRCMYPLFEQLARQNVLEVQFAYALAYNDIGDAARAMQAVTPITADPKNPLYLQAIFLRAQMLTDQKDFVGAYDQLQVLAGSPDKTVSIRAQVKQAEVLYAQGNKAEAIRLISDIVARYNDLPDINDAYLVVGLEKFKSGSFQDAFRAFDSIGIPGAPPRQSVAIGKPFEIKVADSKLNAHIADFGLPVIVTSDSGDKEEVMLKPAFSRGVYLGSVETALGVPKPGDGILQVRGNDKIRVHYIDRLSADGANVERTVALNLATDASLMAVSQAGLAVFREAQGYQKKNILDENFELVGVLPKTASKFFRNPQDGTLYKKGARFNFSFLGQIKAGQPFYAELNDPDEDITDDADKVQVEVTTTGGQKQLVTLLETGPHTGLFTTVMKTTLEDQPKEGALSLKKNDGITARYVDPNPEAGTRDPVHIARIGIQMTTDGKIFCEREILAPIDDDKNHKVLISAVRVPNGSQVFVNVVDRDLDITEGQDKVKVSFKSDSGGALDLTAVEDPETPGTFIGTFRVATAGAAVAKDLPVITVKPGDLVTAGYLDEENKKNAPETREFVFRVNIAENANVVIARQIVETVPVPPGKTLVAPPPPKVHWEDTDVLVPGSMYRVTLTDGDVVPTRSEEMWSKVTVKAANGANVDVPLQGKIDEKLMTTVYTGQFFARLGDTTSPIRAYFSQTGGDSLSLIDMKSDEDVSSTTLWSVPAINVQGKDKVNVVYIEPITADMKADQPLNVPMRVAADATMELVNAKGNLLSDLKPGMAFELRVTDPVGDATNKRDTIKATLTTAAKDNPAVLDKLDVTLSETDIHSGIFSAIVPTMYAVKNDPVNAILEMPFDGKLTVTYRDETTISGKPANVAVSLATRPLGDAEGLLLTKVYDDPKFEVETLVRLGESLYAVGAAELATTTAQPAAPTTPGTTTTTTTTTPATTPKPATTQGRTNPKLQEAARLLQEVIDRFPSSQYVVESLFLTGKIRREEKNLMAEKLFTRVIEEYPDSDFVPQALYQLVLYHYDQDDIEKATDACMRLVYGFPKNTVVADAVLRIAEYYYRKKKDYTGAAFIYKRLIERFPDNPKVDLIKYRMATAYYLAGLAGDPASLSLSIRFYLEFVEQYKDHELSDDALYWAANAYQKQFNVRKAFTMLTRLLITYPTGDMVPYATRLRDKIKDDNPNIQSEAF